MIRILIIDDEPASVNILKILIQKHIPVPKTIETTTSATEGIGLIQAFKPTLLLLDIKMPEMDGFDLLSQAADGGFDVIFTTAYDHFAIKAIRLSALDYLLKPIDAAELQNAINRHIAKQAQQDHSRGPLFRNLLYNLKNTQPSFDKLAIPTLEKTYFFNLEDIVYCEGSNNYTHFHFMKQPPVIASRTLKEYEEMLEGCGFVRVHKSYLVNRQHISYLNREGTLRLSNGKNIPVSRRKKESLLNLFKNM